MPSKVYKKRPLAERFWEKVDKKGPDDCWKWKVSKNKYGYGQITFNNTICRAPRISLYLKNGEMPPDDKFVCHKCNNPGCVNPAHLYIGTQKQNMADMMAAGRNNQAKGKLHGLAKLTEDEIVAIRALYTLGNITQAQLGSIYDVSHQLISKIINRKIWKHV